MSDSQLALTDRSARPSLVRLARVEARKMIDTRAGAWLLGLTVLAAIGGVVGERFSSGGDSASMGDMFLTAAGGVSLLLPVIGILLVTSEWSQRTGLITFSLVPVRERVVVAKLMAALAIAVIATAICLLLAALGAVSADGAGLELGELGRGLLYQCIAVSIGVGLGLLLMNSPAAIVIFFVGPLLISAIGAISESIDDVTDWLDQSKLVTLVEQPGPSSEDWDKIWVTLLVWAIIPLVLGTLRLRRGDID